jgi:tripartite-type tricarboxylate transporter receptor subunit TctC
MLRWIGAGLVTLLSLGLARAESVEDFYKGRTVQLVVGYGPGGGYDVYARVVAQHLGQHIPGHPTVVVQNMPGAGSLRATNYLYNTAPRDGTVVGAFARDMPLIGVLAENASVQFDPRKFTWLGSVANSLNDAYLMVARKAAKVKTIEDALKPGGAPLVIGATGEGGGGNDWAVLLRDQIGLNLKLILGYPDSGALFIAIERDEIDGRSLDYSALRSSRPQWLAADSPVHVLLQFGRATRHPDFPDVPTAGELARTPQAKGLINIGDLSNTLARPFAAPPGLPPDRARALQEAFRATVRDPAFLADAAKLRIDVSPLDGPDILHRIDEIAASPVDELDYLRKLHADQSGKH